MKMLLAQSRLALLLLLALVALGLSACSSTEENTSSRPWNQPYGWENGLGGMNQYNR